MRRRIPVSLCELALLGSAIVATCSTVVLALFYPSRWARVGREDGLIETAGAVALLVLSVVAAKRLVRSPRGARAPSVAAVLIGVAGAGEEISWGQRMFDIAPPPFFAAHNVQGEINVHNLLHPPWDALLGAALILGFCLSPLWSQRSWVRRLVRRGLPWPRPIHASVLAVCLGAGLLVAVTTGVGDLEELGELVFVLVVAATWCGNENCASRPEEQVTYARRCPEADHEQTARSPNGGREC